MTEAVSCHSATEDNSNRPPAKLLAEIIQAQQVLAESELEVERLMQVVTEMAQQLTRAAGAVLEMAAGDELVYRAASGLVADQVGLRLKVARSLSGHCLRTGEFLRCDDSEEDPRVDRDVCRRIGLRSMVVAPLNHGGTTVGVLKVLSSAPNGFGEQEVATLRIVAGMMGTAMGRALACEENRRLMAAVRESEERFRNAIDYAPIGMALVSPEGEWIRVNRALCEIVGYSEQEMLATSFQAITHPDDLGADLHALRQFIAGETSTYRREKRYIHKGGWPVWIELSVSRVCDDKNRLLYFVSQVQDITERRKAEHNSRHHTRAIQLLNTVAVAAGEARDLAGAIQLVLDEVCSYAGWPVAHAYICTHPDEGGELLPSRLWHMDDPERWTVLRELSECMSFSPGTGMPGEVARTKRAAWIVDVFAEPSFIRGQKRKDLGVRTALFCPVLVEAETVAVLEFFSDQLLAEDPELMQVITQIGTLLGRVVERERAEEKLRHGAYHDPLTGLPNRLAFMETLERAIARARRNPSYVFAVLFLDLDRFKVINDSLGHLLGDQLLQEVSKRLQRCLRSFDVVARLGGDEFTILLDDINGSSSGPVTTRVAQRILTELQRPFLLDQQEVFTGVSIGIAFSSGGYVQPEDILRDADNALYRAKARGRGGYEIFDPDMHQRAVSLLHLEMDLRHALERNQLEVFYQPIVSLKSQSIVGFEALVRWRHPERGLVSPGEFIPIAEETGLIVPIGNWVLREACRWMKTCCSDIQNDGKMLTISVNVSARQFAQPELIDHIATALAETGLDPRLLKLEITESTVMAHAEQAATMMARLKALNVELQIDDFGTGYSSLSYLHLFPIDALKIDRSFVSKLHAGEGTEIVQAVLALAGSLRIGVVAEGVELQEQAAVLEKLGCLLAQGYYFSRPIEAQAARRLLDSGLASSSAGKL